jgi:hypothetical protein
MSRLLKPAAMSSRLFFAATIDAFSLVLSLFALFAIVGLLLKIADLRLPIADLCKCDGRLKSAIGNWQSEIEMLVAPVACLL